MTLIFEDDVEIDPTTFAQSLNLAKTHVQKLGYIQFQVRDVIDQNKVQAQSEAAQIIQPTVTPLRTSAQFVSYETAQKLLNITSKFDRPIDTFLQMFWETRIHICCVVPSGVTDKTQEIGGSTISKNTSLKGKFKKEYGRFSYRKKVKKFSIQTLK
ncbi:MAG: hypothetical protein COB84_00330 [Rhodobacteraceae bacterium]|nr:MAG: hypothetical protein COB84_00330 [Paracoccaceae bacterium]